MVRSLVELTNSRTVDNHIAVLRIRDVGWPASHSYPGHPLDFGVLRSPSPNCLMKSLQIGLFAAVSLLFVGCGQKATQITSTSSTPSPSPKEIVREPDPLATPEIAPSPSQSITSKGGLVFETQAATQAADQYLETYKKLLNDINAPTSTKSTDPQTELGDIKAHLQRIAQDTTELANQESQVQRVLTPDELKRLMQYRETVEQ
jgi:hypothetical protein